MLRRCLTVLSLVGCLAAAGDGRAAQWVIKDHSAQARPMRLDVVGIFEPVPIGAGVGVWFSYPIVPNGFLPMLNDTFSIEGGGAYTFHWDGVYACDWTWQRMRPMAGVRWDFHLTNAWTVFAKAKAGGRIDFARSSSCTVFGVTLNTGAPATSYDGLAFDFGVGGFFNLNDLLAIRLEVSGTDAAFDVDGGIGFKF